MGRFFHTIPLWVLGLFILLTLLIEAPLIAFPFYAGGAYQGINIIFFGNDEHHYLSRAKEVLEGHPPAQPYLSEGKDLPDSFQSNIEQILLTPLRVIGLARIDVPTLYNVMNAFGVFLLLILMYVFVYALSADALLAASAAVFAIGGYWLVENGTILSVIVRHRDIVYENLNIFGRSAFPYMALVPFLVFLNLSYRAVMSRFERFSRENARPYLFVLGAGACFGFLFYVYFYAWTFALALCGSLALAALLWRRYTAFFAISAIALLGLAIGIPKLIGYYQLFTSPLGEQYSYFFMTLLNRDFIESSTGIATALIFAVYFYFRRKDENNFFLFAVLLAGWVALEQQMITGHAVQYGHYYWYFVVPLSILVTVYMMTHLISREWPRLGVYACTLLIVLAFLNTAAGQYRSFLTYAPWEVREQDFGPLLRTLQTRPKGVVLGDPGGASYPLLVTIFTDDDLYWLPAATTSALPPEHMHEALLVYLYLNKDARRDPVSYLKGALASSAATAYTILYEQVEGLESGILRRKYEKIPMPHTDPEILAARAAFLPEIGKEYKTFTRTPQSVRAALEARGVKYVLWDMQQYPEWDLSPLGPLTLIATSTDLVLYSLSTTE